MRRPRCRRRDRRTTPPLPETTIPPYQAKLERLAELMGTLAFMRSLCGTGDGALWRNKMSELLVAEGTTVDRRDRLAGAFNHGLRSYAATYRICTPAARTVIGRSLAEGEKLTNDLATHFGS